ncbi:hypothetical protein [Streptomyces sp. NPDC058653]|uniref:hypothetical protein n=1 Tax=Streptomyces sp. NPDC058653 TaxID=3346576 RepID=UPI00364F162C
MRRWANEGPHGPNPMTPALRVEIRSDLNRARGRLVYGVVLTALGVGVNIWMFLGDGGHIAVLAGGLALGPLVILGAYLSELRIRRYLRKHDVSMAAVTGRNH